MEKNFSLFLKEAQNKGSLKYFTNFDLSSVCSAGTGGSAVFFITPYTVSSLTETVKSANCCGIKYRVIGNASNILFPDQGFDGAIISSKKINTVRVNINSETGKKEIYAECGVMLPVLSKLALKNSLYGFAGLTSIPATVGGALITNAGAFGDEISDTLTSFTVYLPERDKTEERTPASYPFSYRNSNAAEGGAIILSALFSPNTANMVEIREKMLQNTEKRKATQPFGVKSVGSFFKKPDYITVNKNVSSEFYGKSAGEIIEICGLKGKTIGGASVSKKHAGFLINSGNATTSDFLLLAENVKRIVFEKTGIILIEECIKIN